TGAKRVVLEGSGHIPMARRPVKANQLISEFAGLSMPAIVRNGSHPRALLVSSPIGLGHAWRDVAIARELRRQVPGLEVEWLAHCCGFVPMPSGGEREQFLVSDYNAEMIEHVDGHPGLRDLSIFIGDPADVVARDFGPGLPSIPEWTQAHYKFSGYVLPFDPATLRDRMALRRELGYHPDAPLIVAGVGGSAVGVHLLRRIASAFAVLRSEMPDAELLM